MLSTGMSKNPWIWSACRSIVSTRATPTDASMFATTLALIATRVEHHQQLHQVVVGRRARRLQHERILAAHVLDQLDQHLAVRELADDRASDGQIEVLRHVLRKARIGVARKYHQAV